jgi:hypothetical protein
MARFTLAILQRGVNQHVACFEDYCRSLAAALRALGHEVTDFDRPGRLIIFGANNSYPLDGTIPDDAIIFNTEQMTSFGGDVRKQMGNFDRWSKHVIFDYSGTNAQKLRDAGAARVVHCPLGYIESMTTIEPAPVQDIDVLFYGAMNPRRREILDALTRAGIEVCHLFGVYGADRDKVIARSKIALNLHYYDEAVFEIFRVSHLLANKVCVVSEDSGKDDELEAFARVATRYCSRGEIVDMCKTLLADSSTRRLCANVGFETFAKISLVENVRKALEQS